MNVAAVRAALRIARRDALRAKGRSALIVAMIGLPMLGLAAADVAIRTGQLPPEEVARREIGAADLVASHVHPGPIAQNGRFDYHPADGTGFDPRGRGELKPPPLAPLLPPGSRVSERTSYYAVRFAVDRRVVVADLHAVDLADDLSAGLVRLRAGRVPAAVGEALLTPRLADTLGVGIGGTLRTESPDGTYRVVGLGVLPSTLDAGAMYVPSATPLRRHAGREEVAADRQWAVDLPPGARDLDAMPALNRAGFRVTPRTWYAHPPPEEFGGPAVTSDAVGLATVVVGLATLEIVLLAGTAFAVGARRRRRELALVAATGGDRGDVRRIVLGGGVVLGLVAGVAGVVGGIALVQLSRPLLERLTRSITGPLDVRPLELAAIVAVGVGTALLATLLPARAAARQPVVSALTGRRGELRTARKVPALALLAIAGGAALAFWAAGDGKAPASRMLVDGMEVVTATGRPAHFNLLLAGAVVAELGFVACAPSLVGLVGRLSARLPLSLRLAARDAARHRTRSGPAVGAVVAAVAGSIAVSVYVASDTERQRLDYQPRFPAGTTWISQAFESGDRNRVDVAAALAELPAREPLELSHVAVTCTEDPCDHWQLTTPERFRCPDDDGGPPPLRDPRCRGTYGPRPGEIGVGPPGLAAWRTGRADAAVADALRAGSVVVFDARWVEDDHVTLTAMRYTPDGAEAVRTVRLPAVVRPAPGYESAPVALMTPETARAHRLPTLRSGIVVTTTRLPTEREEAAARGAATQPGSYVELYVERGFRNENALVLLALLGASTLVTVGATGMATGLAAADSRPDLATLSAVGAPPRVRRRLAMAQAATVAGLGSALGILAGLVPAVAVVAARAEFPFVAPWTALIGTAVGVPVLAALLVGAVTRGRLPLDRRLA